MAVYPRRFALNAEEKRLFKVLGCQCLGIAGALTKLAGNIALLFFAGYGVWSFFSR